MVTEQIELEGHIIDSLTLSKVIDEILVFGGDFEILQMQVGRTRTDRSRATLAVSAPTADQLSELLVRIARYGATVRVPEDVHLVPAPADGVFPDGFYSTTNQRTEVRFQGEWWPVQYQEMDCGILYNEQDQTFSCIPIHHVRKGDRIVVSQRGVRVLPQERSRQLGSFEFMSSAVSTEKPKNVIIADIADRMKQVRAQGRKILLVAGPAVVHTGATEHVVKLIETGFIHILFAGNALPTHDLERALFGTSLGVYLDRATPVPAGHEHHLRTINTIRRYGSIEAAIGAGIVTDGIMYACIKHKVEMVLAGSIRDDGPLPGVITDTVVAADRMRACIRAGGIGLVLMVASTLHSVATGNLLPADIPAVCVDISPATITKLADRGSFQTVGLVSDVEPFLRELLTALGL